MPATESAAEFAALRESLAKSGPAGALAQLVDHLRTQDQPHELFEALKLQLRERLGLPLVYSDATDDLSEAKRIELENGLIEACKEVGGKLLSAGRIRDGWMYLRPVGDRRQAAEMLKNIEPNEENQEELIEVCLHEGLDVPRGFQLVLDQYGVCNAITTFDTALGRLPLKDRQAAARLLLRRLHADLLGNVRYDIARQEGTQPAGNTLAELVADRDWLLQDGQYHIDTTHLSSTVRIARILTDAADLRLALDLTAYGRRLHTQFQFRGDEPFVEVYPTHALYYQALLNEDRAAALDSFRGQAETLDQQQFGTVAVEVYVDLLARTGSPREAITEFLRLVPAGTQTAGLAPSLYELSQQAGDFAPWISATEARGDLLGFAIGLVTAAKTPSQGDAR